MLFLWQTQIQTIEIIEYGLNDAIQIKKKQLKYIATLLIYTPWYEFQTILMTTNDFGRIFVTKKLLPCNILILLKEGIR